jgi:hypothetical protein
MLLVSVTCGVGTAQQVMPRYFTITPTVLEDMKDPS